MQGKRMDRLIKLDDAISAMDELEDEDIEAYGCKIPEGFDGERARLALCLIKPVEAISIEDIKAAIGRLKTEKEFQIAEKDIKSKLLLSDVCCELVKAIAKLKEGESE